MIIMEISDYDVLKIAKMDAEKRKSEMMGFFNLIEKENDENRLITMVSMIKKMKNAADEEYLNLCLTNMDIVSTFGDSDMKDFMALRMKANSELPDDMKSRDMKMINDAMKTATDRVRTRLTNAMPKN